MFALLELVASGLDLNDVVLGVDEVIVDIDSFVVSRCQFVVQSADLLHQDENPQGLPGQS